MKKKVAQIIADFLVEKGVTDVFTITGGGAMHLNDALGHKEGLKSTYNHHEQACAIAAEGYARYSGKVAAVCVTSGPGGTNAITGVLGGWQDSIPMFVISGQVKRETTMSATDNPLRQLGDQEFNIIDCVKPMTKYAHMVWNPEEIMYHLEKAWYLCNNGRKGPVWLDIPLDVQAYPLDPDELTMHFDPDEEEGIDDVSGKVSEESVTKLCNPEFDEKLCDEIIDRIQKSSRPAVFAGTAIDLAGCGKEFLELVNTLKIPVLTAWNAHDILPSDSPYDCGRPGTVGNRGGNFTVQNCDLLIVLGSRLNIRLISYNYKDFAKDAYKIIVDIDKRELNKPTVKPDLPICADVKDVITALKKRLDELMAQGNSLRDIIGDKSEWLAWSYNLNKEYPACLPEYFDNDRPLNPYAFIDRLFRDHLQDNDAIACGNGSACVITFQGCYIKNNQRLFTNSGCAAMGYGFPAAIGVAVNRGSERTVCIDGDGSFQMNLQELQTVVYNNLNLKIIILNNNGYHSIRQTQTNLFKGQPYVGICDGNGLSFPDLSKLIPAYGIAYYGLDCLSELDDTLTEFFAQSGPALLEVFVDEKQNFEPKLSSKVLPDGRIVSPPQDDMFPFIGQEKYDAIVAAAKAIN